jgi:Na+-transporting methylmalonyl-CoA/oxaloacetate decarboxylase gamma subunit
LTEYFAALARSYDIEYKMSNKDYKKEKQEKENAKITMLLQAAVKQADTQDEGTAMLQNMADFLEQEVPEEAMPEEAVPQEEVPEAEELQQVTEPAEEPMPPEGAGLMARGA